MSGNKIYSSCPDCGVAEGEYHLDGCDWELCTKCGKQVLAWGRCKGAKKGRYFSRVAFWCERCGVYLPKFKMVDDDIWEKICAGNYEKDCILCPKCMDFIIDKEGLKNNVKSS